MVRISKSRPTLRANCDAIEHHVHFQKWEADVLCNTSLNFRGKGFINQIDDLALYVGENHLDGFVVEGRSYILKSSARYQAYLDKKRAKYSAR
jgi:predicted NodU family carbamoyl transferase